MEETEKDFILKDVKKKYRNDKNLFYVSMKKVFDKFGYNIKGLKD